MKDKARKIYEENILIHEKKSDFLNKKSNLVGWSRLGILILVIVIDYIFYKKNDYGNIAISSILGIFIFVILVIYHNNILDSKRKEDILLEVNKKGIKRIEGRFKEFEDDGKEFLDYTHPFTNDLDVFGNN